MRFVPTEQLVPGMILGQDMFDAMGIKLLSKENAITRENISYLEFIGTAGVYIDDEISKDIALKEVVSPQVKQQAVALIQDVFSKTEDDDALEPEERMIRLVVENVVDDVLADENVMYNIIDIKTYSDYTYFHSMNVGVLAGILGAKMSLPEDEMKDLVTSAFLHDIGKMLLPDYLRNMERRLTPQERENLRNHSQLGYDYLTEKFSFSDRVNQAVYQHHEWYNGQGYPNRYKGKELCRNARILRAADQYDTMTSKMPYRPAYQPADVMEYIMARTGLEFDPQVVKVMSSQLCIYPIGSEVVLSDGRHGIVVENHIGFIGRPTIRLMDTGEEINLRGDRSAYNITITQLLV